jgi:Ca2+-binding RTX toxin-like protein
MTLVLMTFLVLGVLVPATGPAVAATGTCGGYAVTIAGTSGDDVLNGTAAADVMAGKAGSDLIKGGAGGDVICGGDGFDDIIAGDGADQVWGEGWADDISGGNGNDTLRGGGDSDRFNDGNGKDFVFGGADAGSDQAWPCYADGYANEVWTSEGDGISPNKDNFYSLRLTADTDLWQPQPCQGFHFPYF